MAREKNSLKIVFTSLFVVISGLCFFAWIIIGMFFGVSREMVDYYKDDGNYEEVACILETRVDHKGTEYISFKPEAGFYGHNEVLHLWENNAETVANSGFFQEVNDGDKVTVITAPGYFWDGYDYPVAGLKTESKTYLEFSTGKENQVTRLQKMRDDYLAVAVPVISVSISSAGLAAIFSLTLLISILKQKKAKQSGR